MAPTLPRLRRGAMALILGSVAFSAPVLAQQATFDIPAAPLSEALIAFGRQSGLQVSFDPGVAAGLTSAGVSGPVTPAAALAGLLAGTGLIGSVGAGGVATISAPAPVAGDLDLGLYLGAIVYGYRAANTLGEVRSSLAVVRAEPDDAPAPRSIDDSFRQVANAGPGDWTTSGFVIRGVNSEGLVPGGNGQPLASLYVDGVQQTIEGVRHGLSGLFDMEQIEVYRGPQSTLSGRAALAGAIYLRSNDPDFTRGGQGQFTLGENDRRQVGLAFGDALSETVAYRISAEYGEARSPIDFGTYARFPDYEDFVTDDYWSLRAKLLWEPNGDDSTRVLLSYARSYDSPASNTIAGPGWPSSLYSGGMRGDLFAGLTPDSYRWALARMAVPNLFELPPEMQQAIVFSEATELSVFEETRSATVDNFGIEIGHDLSDALRLTALTSYSHSLTGRNSINADLPNQMMFTVGEWEQQIISQEVRLNYESGPIEAVGGLYAARVENGGWRTSRLLAHEQSRNNLDIDNVALFGQIRYEITPEIAVIGGGRFDWIHQSQDNWYQQNFGAEVVSSPEFTDTAFLPLLGVEYDFAPGQSVGLVYQEGYRPGGAGFRISDQTDYTYDPEFTQNIELSWRGAFLEDRLNLAANVFFQKWRGQQIEVFANPTSAAPWDSAYIANAGRSESYGAELEIDYAASDMLRIGGSLGLLQTEFTDFNLQSWGVDMTGEPFPGAPEYNLALGFRWGGDEGLFVSGLLNSTGASTARLEENGLLPYQLDSYSTVDLEVGWAWQDVRLTAYATNLFDKRYNVYEGALTNLLTQEVTQDAVASIGDPREIGLRLDYRF